MPGPFRTSGSPKSPDSPTATGKDMEGSDLLTKHLQENAPSINKSSQPRRDKHNSFLLLHIHGPRASKSLHSRNSKEGLASDKTQEETFIDLFI